MTFRKLRKLLREFLDCRMKRCDYYTHYLAYGPAELTHIGYHSAIRLANAHFDSCRIHLDRECPVCTRWEKRVRA